jgi:hypothetical protein
VVSPSKAPGRQRFFLGEEGCCGAQSQGRLLAHVALFSPSD